MFSFTANEIWKTASTGPPDKSGGRSVCGHYEDIDSDHVGVINTGVSSARRSHGSRAVCLIRTSVSRADCTLTRSSACLFSCQQKQTNRNEKRTVRIYRPTYDREQNTISTVRSEHLQSNFPPEKPADGHLRPGGQRFSILFPPPKNPDRY